MGGIYRCDEQICPTCLRYRDIFFTITLTLTLHTIGTGFIASACATVPYGLVYHVRQAELPTIVIYGAQLAVDGCELDVLTQLPVTLQDKLDLDIVNVHAIVLTPATSGLEPLLAPEALPAHMVLAGGFRGGQGLAQQLAADGTRKGLAQVRQQLIQLCPALAVLWLCLHDQPASGHVEARRVHLPWPFIGSPPRSVSRGEALRKARDSKHCRPSPSPSPSPWLSHPCKQNKGER